MIAGHEGQQMAFDNDETLQQQLDFIASSSTSDKKYERKCDKKCCNVGRNQVKTHKNHIQDFLHFQI